METGISNHTEILDRITRLEERVNEHHENHPTAFSTRMYYWGLGILFVLVCGSFGYTTYGAHEISTVLQRVSDSTLATATIVSQMKTNVESMQSEHRDMSQRLTREETLLDMQQRGRR